MDLTAFTLDPRRIPTIGRTLARPENVLAFRDLTVFASSNKGYLSRIDPDGQEHTIGALPGGEPTTMALDSEDSFPVNNTADGNIYRLYFDGRSELVLADVGEHQLGSANYVFLDSKGRLWIAVATRRRPPHRLVHIAPDGYILLVDRAGPGSSPTASVGQMKFVSTRPRQWLTYRKPSDDA